MFRYKKLSIYYFAYTDSAVSQSKITVIAKVVIGYSNALKNDRMSMLDFTCVGQKEKIVSYKLW